LTPKISKFKFAHAKKQHDLLSNISKIEESENDVQNVGTRQQFSSRNPEITNFVFFDFPDQKERSKKNATALWFLQTKGVGGKGIVWGM